MPPVLPVFATFAVSSFPLWRFSSRKVAAVTFGFAWHCASSSGFPPSSMRFSFVATAARVVRKPKGQPDAHDAQATGQELLVSP